MLNIEREENAMAITKGIVSVAIAIVPLLTRTKITIADIKLNNPEIKLHIFVLYIIITSC